jgi:succinate dehydrogenase subunit C
MTPSGGTPTPSGGTPTPSGGTPTPSGGKETDLRLYRPRVSIWWWTRKRTYVVFVIRELSSIFVAWFVVYLLLLVDAVHGGSDSYRRFLDWAGSPWVVVLNIVALAFVVLHAVTWFNLAPRALVIRMQGQRLPSWMVAAGHFAAWALASAAIAWIVLRGL